MERLDELTLALASQSEKPAPCEILRRPTSDSGREREREHAAMDAVLAFCSRKVNWPGRLRGLEATSFGKHGDRTLVNVSVYSDHPSTEGNVLWYQVRFSDDDPSTIKAMRAISGQLCGGISESDETPLR